MTEVLIGAKTLSLSAAPNAPDCVITGTSSANGVAQLSYHKTDLQYIIDAGFVEAVSAGPDTWEYTWTIKGISELAAVDYTADAIVSGLSASVDWTQPKVTETGNEFVIFPDALETRIAKVSNMLSKLGARGYTTPDEWSELKRLLKSIIIRGTAVTISD